MYMRDTFDLSGKGASMLEENLLRFLNSGTCFNSVN